MRRRRADTGIRAELAEHERVLLGLAVGVGDDHTAALFRAHLADLESGGPVVVPAADVGLPTDEGTVTLEADGRVTTPRGDFPHPQESGGDAC